MPGRYFTLWASLTGALATAAAVVRALQALTDDLATVLRDLQELERSVPRHNGDPHP